MNFFQYLKTKFQFHYFLPSRRQHSDELSLPFLGMYYLTSVPCLAPDHTGSKTISLPSWDILTVSFCMQVSTDYFLCVCQRLIFNIISFHMVLFQRYMSKTKVIPVSSRTRRACLLPLLFFSP